MADPPSDPSREARWADPENAEGERARGNTITSRQTGRDRDLMDGGIDHNIMANLQNPIPTRELNSGMPFQNLNWSDSGLSVLSANSSRASSSGLNESRFQGSSSSLQSLPTRKRQRDNYSPSLLSGEFPDPKSRKATPIQLPAATTSSPSSRPTSRLSENNNRGLGELLGFSDDESFSDIQREQLEAERQLEERREQERRDAEIARFLEDEWEPSRAPSASPAPSFSTIASLPPPPGPTVRPSLTQAGPSQQRGAPATGSGYAASAFRRFPSPKVPEYSPNRSQQGYIDISSDSDIEEIRPSAFSAYNRAPGPTPTPASWNHHQTTFVDGRSWPTVDSSYTPARGQERVLGPAGPRSLEPGPSGPYPIPSSVSSSYDRAASWRNEAAILGSTRSSMPGLFPGHVPGQYPTDMGAPKSVLYETSFPFPSFFRGRYESKQIF